MSDQSPKSDDPQSFEVITRLNRKVLSSGRELRLSKTATEPAKYVVDVRIPKVGDSDEIITQLWFFDFQRALDTFSFARQVY